MKPGIHFNPILQRECKATTIYLRADAQLIWDAIPRGKKNEFVNDLLLASKGILKKGTIKFIDYRRIREIVRSELRRCDNAKKL